MGKLTEKEGENTDESDGVWRFSLRGARKWIWGHNSAIAVPWNQGISYLETAENEEFPHCKYIFPSLPSLPPPPPHFPIHPSSLLEHH